MTGEIHVRPARGSDRHRLAALWLELIEHHRQLAPGLPGLRSSRESILEEIERGLGASGCRIFVAVTDEESVGFLFAEAEKSPRSGSGGIGLIHEVYVPPERRRLGVGAALVGAGVEWLRERGASRVSVRVETANPEAHLFWKRHGFYDRAFLLERPIT